MACTTLLVGKAASYDGSTIVARNEDSPGGQFHAKRFLVMAPESQPRTYRSVLTKVEIPLPGDPLRYTYMPDSDPAEGVWGAFGVNELNVSMTATETITSNERVLGADPLVTYQKASGDRPEVIGGIGEEDFVTLVLPYIKSARDGVRRLGALLEKYGTDEMNGIAFQDESEIWWLETIGGHHWLAARVPDDAYVVMPNQLGISAFDFDDAYGDEEHFMCAPGLKQLVEDYHLDLRLSADEDFNPRHAFGSDADSDHVYNTPRAWVMLRYFNGREFSFDGPDAQFMPEDNNLPWSLIPERKITLADVKRVLSDHYQGTPYDVYGRGNSSDKGRYRPIGINRNNALGVVQIRPYMPEMLKVVTWLALGSNPFNALVPFYSRVTKTPAYLASGALTPTTDSFYWTNRLLGALADAHFHETSADIERYQIAVNNQVGHLLNTFDQQFNEETPSDVTNFLEEANEKIADTVKELTDDALGQVLYTASCGMKNGFSLSDN